MYDKIRFDPKEHDGIGWFPVDALPFNEMIVSDRHWLPELLRGEQRSVRIVFDKTEHNLVSCTVRPARFS